MGSMYEVKSAITIPEHVFNADDMHRGWVDVLGYGSDDERFKQIIAVMPHGAKKMPWQEGAETYGSLYFNGDDAIGGMYKYFNNFGKGFLVSAFNYYPRRVRDQEGTLRKRAQFFLQNLNAVMRSLK